MKLTPKQEKFARKYIECSNASEAYRVVYGNNATPKSVNEIASRLLVKVQSRVRELQAKHEKRHMVTVDTIAAELDEARNLAVRIEQPSAAVSATMGKAKIYGLLIDKTEVTGKNGAPIQIEQMNDDQLNEAIAALAGKAGIAGIVTGKAPQEPEA